MEIYLEQLETLKYSELQRLAKGAGLRANVKADKLLKALKHHFYEIQEHEKIVSERDSFSSVDTKALDGSQIPLNVSFAIQRYRKKKEDDDDLGNPEGKTVHEENKELCPEKEVFSELKGREEPQNSGPERTVKMNQSEYLTSSGITKNVATPSQCKKRISTKCKRLERRTLVDPLSGKKPEYTTSLSKSGRTGFASSTPNFKKLHEAQFKKMESIDDYIERKTVIKNFSNSVNKVKKQAKKNNHLKTSRKVTPNSNSKTCSSVTEFLLSPHPHGNNRVATCTPASLRRSPHSSVSNGNKSILTRKSAFNSTSLSAIKMNVRFSEATKDNEHKRSLIKTPSRKSPFLNTCTPDGQKSSISVSRKDFGGSTTKSVIFKFEGPAVEPSSTKKPAFDLKASLSRPLGYQPHKGKLKPWGKSKENIQSVHSHKKDYKQPVPATREERRQRHEEGRKLRKDKAVGIRRGLTLV
ncbi:nucleolar and spindle-associated protein 1 isoform X2 [Heteronotia binoei]|uniref:nucleolar and spindle-associated protein 1 isoform X2 n=1 Tax=Heteronotia binoei TaxID=13085 RepID=UPI002931AD32|nr:nucleolar and spindle-associated protein 1 isoform X2 [Heteronotia binoei]